MRFVEFAGPRGMLRGCVHLPAGVGGSAPGVVMCHGLTGERMESSFLFVGLSRRLEAAGIASLRFDFYGSGESDGEFHEMTVTGERADASAAIDFFRALDEIDAARVGLLGLSLGGYVTACVSGSRADIKAAALWSAAGNTRDRWMARFSEAQRARLQGEGWVDVSGLRLSREFFDDLALNKPYDLIARYRGPVLVVHGTKDETVPLAEAQQYVKVLKARRAGKSSQLPAHKKVFIEGAGHVFANYEHRQKVYDATAAWFARCL